MSTIQLLVRSSGTGKDSAAMVIVIVVVYVMEYLSYVLVVQEMGVAVK